MYARVCKTCGEERGAAETQPNLNQTHLCNKRAGCEDVFPPRPFRGSLLLELELLGRFGGPEKLATVNTPLDAE